MLLLHGTGGNENDLVPLASRIAPDAAVLSPRGKVLENGMPRFFRRFPQGTFDLEDLRVRTDELAGFVETASAAYKLDSRRVVAVGYSNGANIAASMLLSHSRLLAGAVLFRPVLPFVPNTVPDLTGIPVLIAAGHLDEFVRAEETERLAALLQETGARVTLRWHASGHELTLDDIEAAKDWLSKNYSMSL